MKCPQCGFEQTCPCEACQKRNPTPKPWIYADPNTIQCAGCGLTENANWWEEQSWNQYKLK